MEDISVINQWSYEEQRIVGVLIEKSKTTPDYYPMSINAIMVACNQKTSRNPVVNYNEETITLTLNTLKMKGFVATVTGSGTRSLKYKHTLAIKYPLLPKELTIIALLLLRGPLTPGEINTNSARMSTFENIEEILEILDKLSSDEPAFTRQIEKKPGQKEVRFMHLFGGQVQLSNLQDETVSIAASTNSPLEERLLKLEQEVAELKEMVNLLLN